ncbi:MAG: polyprenyl synthetase family protein [Muribaculum sp.]|nr:polyprenyl synthetase family protein [Muribaculum sp.]
MKTTGQYLEMINNAIEAISYPAEPDGLYAPIRYTLEGGGKRIRPVLLLATCDACGGDASSSINQATGLEMFHNFTLLHDDVMDRASMRRGRPTVHIRWNESTAILSGDAMLTMASTLIGRCDTSVMPKILDLFNRTAMEIYEGQQYDMDFETRDDVTADEYINMIRLKTSVLLGCACAMGAIMAGANDDTCKAMYDYGVALGLAFQLQDDWLDTFGDPIIFGKNIGGDILNDKKTYLLITTLSLATPEQRDTIVRYVGDRSQEKIEAITALYRSTGAETDCREKILSYGNDAIAALSRADIPESARSFFRDIVKKSLDRDH